jgi:PKD repeat protein
LVTLKRALKLLLTMAAGSAFVVSAAPAALAQPGNDDFANAVAITALPASRTVDLTSATMEPSEPAPSCFYYQAQSTAWYSFTPDTTESVTVRIAQYGAFAAVYTGASLATLNAVACNSYYYQPAVFRAEANTTYYIQVGASCCGVESATLSLDIAPDPTADFYYYPSDPSTYDTVSFQNNSYDPAGGYITSYAWNFGDGATSTGSYPYHQYANEGDYPVQLTITTADGRTASITKTVQVRNHDVAVVAVGVPNTAHPGQTVGIDVRLRNNRYPETVRVDLSVSDPNSYNGFKQVGSLTQLVPVRPPGGTTTRFAFSYTVTPADGTIGKITFQANATIVDHRDALPADNQLLSPPVKIS